jgi:hypothetical protein
VTTRRVGVIIVICILIGVALTLGLQRLTTGGVPLPTVAAQPTAATTVGGSGSPSPIGSALGLPRQDLTPGAINPAATQDNLATTVCKPGWARSVRPPSAYTAALKLVQIVEYGYTDRNPSHYQEDHLVPLELGGAPRDRRNLWPEPNATTLLDGSSVGSHQKDALEDALHAQVCAGSTTLAAAQLSIAGDWIAAWKALP